MRKAVAPAVVALGLVSISCAVAPAVLPRPERVFGEASDYVRIRGRSLRFWRSVMTPAVARKYRATKRTTFCNVFVGDTLKKYFGKEVFAKVFPEGVKSPNIMYQEWQTNPNLLRLGPDNWTPARIQSLADDALLVLLAYRNPRGGPGHLALVGHSRLVLFTIPKIKKLEGKTIAALGPDWLPVVVQAGNHTGVSSVVYASNRWLYPPGGLFENGAVMFYLVLARPRAMEKRD